MRLGERALALLERTVGPRQLLEAGQQQREDLLGRGRDGEFLAEEADVDALRVVSRALQCAVLEHLTDTGQQVLGLVRLGDVVVGAALEAAHDVAWIVEAGEQDDERSGGAELVLDTRTQIVTADAGHDHVGEDEVGWRGAQLCERILAARRGADAEAGVLEERAGRLELRRAVVDDENGRGGHGPFPATSVVSRGAIRSSGRMQSAAPRAIASRAMPKTMEVASS